MRYNRMLTQYIFEKQGIIIKGMCTSISSVVVSNIQTCITVILYSEHPKMCAVIHLNGHGHESETLRHILSRFEDHKALTSNTKIYMVGGCYQDEYHLCPPNFFYKLVDSGTLSEMISTTLLFIFANCE